jgi:hypothetical protein
MTDSSSSSCSSSTAARVGLPQWLGVDVPLISAAEAALLLEDQLWFEPFGRADAAKLLEIGCDAKVRDVLGHNGGDRLRCKGERCVGSQWRR